MLLDAALPPSQAPLAGKDIRVQKLIPKLALRVILPAQFNEVGQLFVDGFQRDRRRGKQLSPVWAHLKWREFLFNNGKQAPDGGPVLLPGEVDRYAGLPVAGAHP